MKKLLWMSILASLAGCTGLTVPPNKTYELGTTNVQNSSLEIVDKRPEASKRYRRNHNGGETFYLGDENFQPGRMEVLKNLLSNKLDSPDTTVPIIVEAFDVYLIDLSGNIGYSPVLTGYAGSVPLAALNGPYLNKIFSREDPSVGCNITVSYRNQQFNQNTFKSFRSSQINEGLKEVVNKTILQIAEKINNTK